MTIFKFTNEEDVREIRGEDGIKWRAKDSFNIDISGISVESRNGYSSHEDNPRDDYMLPC